MIPLPKLFFVAIEDFADLFVNRPHDWSNCASCVEILAGYQRSLAAGLPHRSIVEGWIPAATNTPSRP